MKKILLGLGLVLVLLILVILILPFVVDLNQYKGQYIPLVEEALNRKVEVENVQLTVIPHIGMRLDGVTIHEDPKFSTTPFLSVPTVQVAVQWAPLLNQKVHVESVQVQKPSIQIIRSADGVLNTASIGKGSSQKQQPAPAPMPEGSAVPILSMFAVERLSLTEGNLQFDDRVTKGSPDYQIEQLEVHTDSVQLGKTANVRVSGRMKPYDVPFEVSGHFGPLQENLDLQTIDVVGQVSNVQILAKGKLLQGKLDLDLEVPSASSKDVPFDLGLTKPVAIKQVRSHLLMTLLAKAGAPTPEPQIDPVTLDLVLGKSSTIQLSGKGTPSRFHLTGTAPKLASQDLPVTLPVQQPFSINQLKFEAEAIGKKIRIPAFSGQAFEGKVAGKAEWDATTSTPTFSASGQYQNFGVQSIAKVLQAESTVSVSGTGNLEWKIAGSLPPSGALQLAGPVHVSVKEGELLGINILRKIDEALNMPGLLSDSAQSTIFSLFDAQGTFEPTGLLFKQILLDSKAFSVRSQGLVSFDQSLGMRGKLALSEKITKKVLKRIPLAKVARRDGRLILPFVTKGTVQNPDVQLDTKFLSEALQQKVEQKLQKALEGDGKELKGLFKEGKGLLKNLFGK